MRYFVKWLLFGSSYTPLFVILLLRDFEPTAWKLPQSLGDLFSVFVKSFQTPWFSYALVVIVLFSNLALFYLLKFSRKLGGGHYKVLTVTGKGSEALNYIVTYIIPFLSFKTSQLEDLISLLIFLVIIAFVYIESNLLYINPMLNIIGYRIYESEVKSVETQASEEFSLIVITSEKRIKKKSTVRLIHLSDDIYLEEK